MDLTTGTVSVLIDGDNISHKHCQKIVEHSKKYGKILIARVYGDFSQTELKNWKNPSITYNIEPIIVWRLNGKNSSDLRLIADVIEIMNEVPSINTFILASGDKDYTTIVSKLKIKGKYVVGISASNAGTSYLLRNCCDEFIILDKDKNIKTNVSASTNTCANTHTSANRCSSVSAKQKGNTSVSAKQKGNIQIETILPNDINDEFDFNDLKDTIVILLENTDDYKMDASQLKDKLLQIDSSFIETNYGHSSFTKLLKSMSDIVYVRKTRSKAFAHLILENDKHIKND